MPGFLGLIPNILAMKPLYRTASRDRRRHGGEGLIAEIVRVEKDEGGQISPDGNRWPMVFLLLAGRGTETTNAPDQRVGA